MKILLLEDDYDYKNSIKEYLETLNYEVDDFDNGDEAYDAIFEKSYQLLILDIRVPGINGYEIVKALRKDNNDIPIIFITSLTDINNLSMGYELGCNDYIKKPFSPKELVLRVQAVLKRTNTNTSLLKDTIYYYKEGYTLFIDKNAHLLKLDDNEIILTAAEWRVLLCLVDNSHLLVSRAKILNECFNYSSESYERIVDTHIKNIRAKIAYGNWIETVRGYGYRFVGVDNKDYL